MSQNIYEQYDWTLIQATLEDLQTRVYELFDDLYNVFLKKKRLPGI